MSTSLMYALIAVGIAAVGFVVFLVSRRKAHPEPPPATRRVESTATPAAPNRMEQTDHGRSPHGGGIEVDELYVGEDELLSTSERHIGDTQPVDRASLRVPGQRPHESGDANGGTTVASAKDSSKRR